MAEITTVHGGYKPTKLTNITGGAPSEMDLDHPFVHRTIGHLFQPVPGQHAEYSGPCPRGSRDRAA